MANIIQLQNDEDSASLEPQAQEEDHVCQPMDDVEDLIDALGNNVVSEDEALHLLFQCM